jgi:hypothetical protein
MVMLTQARDRGQLPAIGSNPHPVSELTWPKDVDPPPLAWPWQPNNSKPIIHEDTQKYIVTPPPGAAGGKGLDELILTGRNYTLMDYWWQKPATVINGNAVWSWTIHLH